MTPHFVELATAPLGDGTSLNLAALHLLTDLQPLQQNAPDGAHPLAYWPDTFPLPCTVTVALSGQQWILQPPGTEVPPGVRHCPAGHEPFLLLSDLEQAAFLTPATIFRYVATVMIADEDGDRVYWLRGLRDENAATQLITEVCHAVGYAGDTALFAAEQSSVLRGGENLMLTLEHLDYPTSLLIFPVGALSDLSTTQA
ncbi:hypothetical protein IHN32_03420 [Deinococcus sp. 14RED07]|uniref:hypothetical protein n=1 Tax=Deinococcus sp. 14RED07 TaxID=2745874 RepID=UPI001E4DCD3F|nr:hypothetical protein [Deinococcus sp. 14RED07]MCD0174999.1 hypothetical protein [Deinococcus sp. 14RED07]